MKVIISLSAKAPNLKSFEWYKYKGKKREISSHKEFDMTLNKGDIIGFKFGYGKWVVVDKTEPSVRFKLTPKEYKEIVADSTPIKEKTQEKKVKKEKTQEKEVKKEKIQEKKDVDLNKLAYKQIEGKTLTKEEYEADPRVGIQFRTGRRGPTAVAITLGFRQQDGVARMVSVTPHKKENLRYLHSRAPIQSYDNRTGTKVSYERYVDEIKKLNDHEKRTTAVKADKQNKSSEIEEKFSDKLKVNNKATIRFSNGLFSRTIKAINYQKKAIGIQGSGSKLRWIPFNLITDIIE